MFNNKTLTRSKTNRTVTGVLGGLGEFFEIDAVLIRVVYVLLTAFSGFVPGIIAYALMALIIPEESASSSKSTANNTKSKSTAKKTTKK